MIFASKSTLSLSNLKILRPKVTKNLMNLCKMFCEFPPRVDDMLSHAILAENIEITLVLGEVNNVNK